MQNIYYSLILLSIFSFTACSENNKDDNSNTQLTDIPEEASLPNEFYKQFGGNIKDNLGVTMHIIREDSVLLGYYYYNNKKEPIRLDGTIKPNHEVLLTEYIDIVGSEGKDSKQTGIFQGKLENNTLSGTWKSDKNSFPFSVKENYPAGSAKLSAKSYTKTYKHEGKMKGQADSHYFMLQISDCGNEAAAQKINADILANVLTSENEEGKQSKKENIEKLMDDFIAAYKTDAADMEKEGTMEMDFNYEESVLYSVEMNQNNLLSICQTLYSFTAGVHGNHNLAYCNYDLRTGNKLNLSDILVANYKDKLNNIGENYFRIQNGIKPNISLKDAGYDFENEKFALNDNFCIHPDGLLFQYNSYEIAAYAVGAPSVLIPYSAMQNLIKKEGVIGGL